jgi:hypothetical protein
MAYSVERLEFACAPQANRAYEAAALRSAFRGINRDRNRACEPLRDSEGHRYDMHDLRRAIEPLTAAEMNRIFQQNRPAV